MIYASQLEELRHDAEAARDIGTECVVRITWQTLLSLLDEIERHRLWWLIVDRDNLLLNRLTDAEPIGAEWIEQWHHSDTQASAATGTASTVGPSANGQGGTS